GGLPVGAIFELFPTRGGSPRAFRPAAGRARRIGGGGRGDQPAPVPVRSGRARLGTPARLGAPRPRLQARRPSILPRTAPRALRPKLTPDHPPSRRARPRNLRKGAPPWLPGQDIALYESGKGPWGSGRSRMG